MARNIKLYMLFAVLVFFAGCALPKPPKPCDINNPVKTVAVLPMKNDTTDVEGPNMVRKKMAEALDERNYSVKDMAEVDQILRDQMGITLGGQLDMTTPQKLGEALGVDGVLYGTLMDFDEVTTGLYNAKKVRAKFKLVNAKTGQKAWERGLGVKSEERMSGAAGGVAALAGRAADARDKEAPWVIIESHATQDKSVGRSLAIGLGKKLISKAVGKHLDYESEEMAKRVTGYMPWGYCGAGVTLAAPEPAPKISIAMPEMKTPEPPSFGYMDYGERDFSALAVSTTFDKNRNNTLKFQMPLAKAKLKIRMDMDMTQMTKGGGQEMPPAFSKMTTIHREDKKVTYSLYPNVNKYLTHKETDEGYYKEPKVEKTKVGSEVIDKHPTDKYKVKITEEDGRIEEGFIWNARDLDGMTIRSEVENKDYKITTELKNIILRTPAASLFEIPAGYTEAANFMELFMGGGQKQK